MLAVKAVDDSDLYLIGIAQYVSFVKADDAVEIMHALNVIVDDAWLNGVFKAISEDRLGEDAVKSGRA